METAGIQRMCSLARMVSFTESQMLVRELAGVEVSAKRVERCAKRIGAEVAADEKECAEPIDTGPSPHFLSEHGWHRDSGTSLGGGRAGRQGSGGPAKTREVKLCVVWSADSRDQEGKPVCDPGSISYSAAIESAAVATQTANAPTSPSASCASQPSPLHQAATTEVVADLAPWIWNITKELFPSPSRLATVSTKEHLATVAKDLFAAGSQKAQAWTQDRWDQLDLGTFDDLLQEVHSHAGQSEEAAKCHQYLLNNRDRMRYPEFEAAGLCTSSGVTEGGCKNAIGARLKRSGMHWTVKGADTIIALRCCISADTSRMSGSGSPTRGELVTAGKSFSPGLRTLTERSARQPLSAQCCFYPL